MKSLSAALMLAVALVGSLTSAGSPGATLDTRAGRAREAPAVAESRSTRARCEFSNRSYAGKCVEKADVASDSTPERVCMEILACLNNAMCAKSYCQSTSVRGGWRLEAAKYDAEERR